MRVLTSYRDKIVRRFGEIGDKRPHFRTSSTIDEEDSHSACADINFQVKLKAEGVKRYVKKHCRSTLWGSIIFTTTGGIIRIENSFTKAFGGAE
ncbi:hypothetical protein O181_014381 [Austropuccinia psidii MF-1]|uniref:Uncharacterized protein n=1 Tax=Austropuccinia psidii MF-1 TaxID=1389203 RepID=A0A9Q3C1L9_9BASI|nr:hypothetical protein [Austropuccinia psidii MF-1]